MGGSDDELRRLYMREIGREPLLTKEEEGLLAQAIERGREANEELRSQAQTVTPARREVLEDLVAAGERSRQRFVRANLRLVVAVARHWNHSAVPLLDLIQEGNLGLMKAVERFDYRRGFRFSTYATWWIRQAITRAVANSGRVVRLPVHTGEALHRLLGDVQHFEQQRGGSPSVETLAAGTGLPAERVSSLLRLAAEPLSLSETVGEDGPELGAVLADITARSPADAAAAALLPAELERLLAVLDSRDRKVVTLRFGLDHDEPLSLEAVGQELGLPRDAVRQSQARALRALRRAALASPETRELLIS